MIPLSNYRQSLSLLNCSLAILVSAAYKHYFSAYKYSVLTVLNLITRSRNAADVCDLSEAYADVCFLSHCLKRQKVIYSASCHWRHLLTFRALNVDLTYPKYYNGIQIFVWWLIADQAELQLGQLVRLKSGIQKITIQYTHAKTSIHPADVSGFSVWLYIRDHCFLQPLIISRRWKRRMV